MLTKRTFVALAAAALIAACSNVTEVNRVQTDTGPLKLNLVRVDTTGMKTVSEGRDIQKSRSQLAADLTAQLKKDLGAVSDPNGLPANVNVSVNELYLARIIDRALVEKDESGQPVSMIIYDFKTDQLNPSQSPEEQLMEKYHVQLERYKEAARLLTGLPADRIKTKLVPV